MQVAVRINSDQMTNADLDNLSFALFARHDFSS